MKGILFSFAVIAASLTFLTFGPAFARDPGTPEQPEASEKPLFSLKTDDREPLFGDRFTLKAGYKVWVAKWQAQASAVPTSQTQVNSDHPSAMNGPTVTGILKLRESAWFNSAFINFTWQRDGFDFAEQFNSGDHFFANRRDYSITGGVAIWEGLGIFAGYYDSRQEFTNQPNAPGSTVERHPRSLRGPIFGIFANVPMSERVSFYGNLAYAQLKFRGIQVPPNFIADTNSAQGWMNEIGVSVTGPRVWRIGTELQLGFRAQIIQKNFGAGATGGAPPAGTNQHPLHDLTYGPVFAVNAVF